jgi:pilus assembly protein Flp/PilA
MSIRARYVWPIISCTKGATAIEYAFIASLISIAIYTAASTIGTNLTNVFSTVASSF